jgi:tripartite-type tricarboxylate transporter receptor subunit TctC
MEGSLLATLACAILTAAATGVTAQTFPRKPVRIISPYPTGITPDAAARLVAEKLARDWRWRNPTLQERFRDGMGAAAVLAIKLCRLPLRPLRSWR